ncbi:MAG: hypothetical protein LBV23_02860 [Deltaproteobacteria bacterium]|jgi:hypothetical protein|nr:hypothetical protein [Deltaproteobacteria bacterium]
MTSYNKEFSELADKPIFTTTDWRKYSENKISNLSISQYCPQCKIEKIYTEIENGRIELELSLVYIFVVKLSCPTCSDIFSLAYAIERKMGSIEHGDETSDLYFRVSKLGEYPISQINQMRQLEEEQSFFTIKRALLINSNKEYKFNLDSFAVVYLHRAYQSLLLNALDDLKIKRPELV